MSALPFEVGILSNVLYRKLPYLLFYAGMRILIDKALQHFYML